jgi:hypothetical protein
MEAEHKASLSDVEHFRELWSKYVSGSEFPLKVENGQVFIRHNTTGGWREWQLDWMHDPREQWTDIERQALGLGYGKHRPDVVPTIPALIFEQDSVRPATEEEALHEPEITGGLLGMICSKNPSQDTAASC